MKKLPVVSLQKTWPPLIIPPVKEGWCKLCGDRRVGSDTHSVVVQFGGGWQFTYPVCSLCYEVALEDQEAESR